MGPGVCVCIGPQKESNIGAQINAMGGVQGLGFIIFCRLPCALNESLVIGQQLQKLFFCKPIERKRVHDVKNFMKTYSSVVCLGRELVVCSSNHSTPLPVQTCAPTNAPLQVQWTRNTLSFHSILVPQLTMIVDNPDPIGKSLENQKYTLKCICIFLLDWKISKIFQKNLPK